MALLALTAARGINCERRPSEAAKGRSQLGTASKELGFARPPEREAPRQDFDGATKKRHPKQNVLSDG